MHRDLFLCHASADKAGLARPLYDALRTIGLEVWFDEAEIHWGDSIGAKIQRGLADSKFILVLLTPNFVAPGGNWRDEELQAALAEQITSGATKVLPLVHAISDEDIRSHLPFVAARRYERMDSASSMSDIARRILQRISERTHVQLLQRKDVDRAVGTVEERLANAAHAVWISGNDNMFVARSLSASVEHALDRGVSIRVLCVDPESPAADMLPRIDPRFPTKEFFVSEVRSVESVLRGWRTRYSRFHYRFLPILPAVGYFITDPRTVHETVKFEIYTAKPWKPIETRPHVVLNAETPEWRQYFVTQYENYWALSRDP